MIAVHMVSFIHLYIQSCVCVCVCFLKSVKAGRLNLSELEWQWVFLWSIHCQGFKTLDMMKWARRQDLNRQSCSSSIINSCGHEGSCFFCCSILDLFMFFFNSAQKKKQPFSDSPGKSWEVYYPEVEHLLKTELERAGSKVERVIAFDHTILDIPFWWTYGWWFRNPANQLIWQIS